jgi:hypothetical protein
MYPKAGKKTILHPAVTPARITAEMRRNRELK